jgi:hypothetical protein
VRNHGKRMTDLEEMVHARAVFKKNVTSTCKTSRDRNWTEFWGDSDTYLTEEQYAQVKHVDLYFFISLFVYYYF